MKPALTPEEWAAKSVELDCGYHTVHVSLVGHPGEEGSFLDVESDSPDRDARPRLEDLSKIAALCLHKQPFGFTREDADHHRRYAQTKRDSLKLRSILGPRAPGFPPSEEATAKLEEMAAWHESMAARIDAMLPPEKT